MLLINQLTVFPLVEQMTHKPKSTAEARLWVNPLPPYTKPAFLSALCTAFKISLISCVPTFFFFFFKGSGFWIKLVKNEYICAQACLHLLSGALTPPRWSSSSWPSVQISSSTSSIPWRLTWPRKACCQRWRRPPQLRAANNHSWLALKGGERRERRAAAPREPRAPLELWEDSVLLREREHIQEKQTENHKIDSLGSFHFMWVWESCLSVFLQSVNHVSDTSVFRLSLWITVLLHISITINLYLVTLLNKMLVCCTFLPVHTISSIYTLLLMCVDILLFFFIISMHCSQRCYSLYSYSTAPSL